MLEKVKIDQEMAVQLRQIESARSRSRLFEQSLHARYSTRLGTIEELPSSFLSENTQIFAGELAWVHMQENSPNTVSWLLDLRDTWCN